MTKRKPRHAMPHHAPQPLPHAAGPMPLPGKKKVKSARRSSRKVADGK